MQDVSKSPMAAGGRVLSSFLGWASRTRRHDLVAQARALLSERGEASGTALAAELLAHYDALDTAQRIAFLKRLALEFGADRQRLQQALERYRQDASPRHELALHAAAEPLRQELIRRLNRAPGGTGRLLAMRADLLRALDREPDLALLDADFRHLFSSWFNPGFLVLKRIDWDTPALILEKIIRYEAVHEITSWDDLRRRIDPEDRRCFAFFHPVVAGEPLIFVEVALTTEMPAAIAPLLATERRPLPARRATTAVFYSISNCQLGLRGVPLGNFLIKRVVEELKRELPNLRQFVTLSPVPEFMAWLARQRHDPQALALSASDRAVLAALDSGGAWQRDAAVVRRLRPVLTAAIAYYLLRARDATGRVPDPVARFHLNNGARLERINWLADPSPKGMAQAAGFMVNYFYDLRQIEENHEKFVKDGTVAASRAVQRLLRSADPRAE
ncbi:MAG: malonyl-CoA decarboxylase [Sutterellaceae bacterium]|nr:malonyl-CoA decarboxylase [Burkholderiaceae bacterium]MCX7902297.1 malonyl-CoA decarboxylase [Burkholderiaceae bacterium]MDW8429239.1 malonyl-CoA decarboxylase [Sutterellaceae bacterium]